MLFRRRIETNTVTKILLLTGGFDTPLAVARGYSTTDFPNKLFVMLHHCLQKLHTSQHLLNPLFRQRPDIFAQLCSYPQWTLARPRSHFV